MRTSRPVIPSPKIASEIDFSDLLARAHRLDRYALAQLHQVCYPVVYQYVNFRLPDEQACTGITAQVFVNFLAALRKRRAPRQNLEGWLLQDASRLVDQNLLDKRSKRSKASKQTNRTAQSAIAVNEENEVNAAADSPTLLPAPGPQIDYQRTYEQRTRFYAALSKLPLDQQHFLALRFSQPRKLSQIALLINKPEAKLRILQQHALQTLHKHLEDNP